MSSLDTADAINAHFTSIVSSLPALDRTQLPAFLPARNPAPMVTRGDMWRKLSRIKVRSAAGPDHIPNRILETLTFELSKYIS